MSALSSVRTLGGRAQQEDRYCMHPIRMNGLEGHLLAVFDGHHGEYVANYCRTHFPGYFLPKSAEDVPEALARAVAQLAEETRHSESGTTLSAACILESHDLMATAALGDSPIVALKKDGSLWRSTLHNVGSNEEERRSAQESGATYLDGYISASHKSGWLQLSRALGDAPLRKVLSDTPDISIIESPSAVLVATDGIFNEEYTDADTLKELGAFIAQDVDANALLNWRIRNGGKLRDNVTILLWKK